MNEKRKQACFSGSSTGISPFSLDFTTFHVLSEESDRFQEQVLQQPHLVDPQL